MNTNKTTFPLGPALSLAAVVSTVVVMLTGCSTMPEGKTVSAKPEMEKIHTEPIILRAGDVLKITFPGAPNLDTTQPIRRDGKLNLPLIGETDADGMTPAALQDKLIQAYSSQLSTKEVTVQVQSSTFPVYVNGAVIHPGKVSSDHPMTALESIMEAGGFNYDIADMKHVRIVREENGVMQHFVIDLKSVLQGSETRPFYLKPKDIVFVPERFSPFQ